MNHIAIARAMASLVVFPREPTTDEHGFAPLGAPALHDKITDKNADANYVITGNEAVTATTKAMAARALRAWRGCARRPWPRLWRGHESAGIPERPQYPPSNAVVACARVAMHLDAIELLHAPMPRFAQASLHAKRLFQVGRIVRVKDAWPHYQFQPPSTGRPKTLPRMTVSRRPGSRPPLRMIRTL